jgi:hypothetical protein
LESINKFKDRSRSKKILTCPPPIPKINPVMNTTQIAEILHNVLSNGQFDSWHKREFEDYIAGEDNAPTKTQILKELEFFISREIR